MALVPACSNISSPTTDSSHHDAGVFPTSSSMPSSSSPSNTNLLQIPLEIRLKIWHLALLAASYDFVDSDYTVRFTPLPFNKPVISVNIVEYKHVTCRPFWGSEAMTRLMRVNKQLYEEVLDVLYKSFAIHVVDWKIGRSEEIWVRWLQKKNPKALNLVQHFHQKVIFVGDSIHNPIDQHGMPRYPGFAIPRGEILASNFPNLKTVVLSSFFHEKYLQGKEELMLAKHIEQILQAVNFWRSLKIEAYIQASPCTGPKGRWIIAEAQKKLGQKQLIPNVFNHTGSRCTVYGADVGYGCGTPNC
jgi:hypothetical protein